MAETQLSSLAGDLDNPFTAKLDHPSLEGVTVRFVYVTPELAEIKLANTPAWQRKKSPRAIEVLATDMAMGNFLFNGDAIRFDETGQQIDGQHRFQAIVESGEPQVMLWVEGLDRKVLAAIDTGRKRTYADLIGMDTPGGRIKYYSITAGTINRYWYWLHGCYGRRGTARLHGTLYTNASPSYAQLNLIAAEGKACGLDFVMAATVGKAAHAVSKIPPSIMGLAWLLFTEIDVDAREKFFFEMITEAPNGRREHPPTMLRETGMRRNKDDKKVEDWLWLHHVITAWNYWLDGKDLNTLRRPAQVSPDSLAMPTGWVEHA